MSDRHVTGHVTCSVATSSLLLICTAEEDTCRHVILITMLIADLLLHSIVSHNQNVLAAAGVTSRSQKRTM